MEKNLYILAEPDDDTQEEIKKYEKITAEYGLTGRQTKDIPYHITLGSYSLDYENYLMDLMETIRIQFKEFNISFSGFGLFGLNVLYLNPDMNLKLIELYNLIKENCQWGNCDLSAHTTILMDEPENILMVLPKITESFKKINGKIKYISLYEFFPKRLIKRIELDA